MEKETIKQKLITELNDNGMLLYADKQKLKTNEIPYDFLQKKLTTFKKQKKISAIAFGIIGAFIIFSLFLSQTNESSNNFLQLYVIQLIPILGILYFSSQNHNLGKKIFILELLLNWEE